MTPRLPHSLRPLQYCRISERIVAQNLGKSTSLRCHHSTYSPALSERGHIDLSPTRTFLSLAGPDVPKFLQGLITNNFPPLTQDSGFYTSFLSGQGRVLFDCFIYPVHNTPLASADSSDPEYLIEIANSKSNSLQAHLKRYKLRSRFNVIERKDLSLYSAWPVLPGPPARQSIVLNDPRCHRLGSRVIVRSDQEPPLDGEKLPIFVYNIRRILNGIPEGPEEIVEGQALPMESNLDYTTAVDFQKGCYIGQELTSRTYHTGVIRKRLLPISLYKRGALAPTQLNYDPDIVLDFPPIGTAMMQERDEGNKARTGGKFLRGEGNLGFGLIRLDKIEDEMKVEWTDENGTTKVIMAKAIRPHWFEAIEKAS